MQISTFYYQLKKMMGFNKMKEDDRLLRSCLSESSEPSEKSIKNIMAFSAVYRYDKSAYIGDVEYLIN